MSILSIFVDESGDFGEYAAHSQYYIVSLVFHDQRNCITDEIRKLDQHLANLNFAGHRIHTGPLIRREDCYKNVDRDTRRKLFYSIANFARKCQFFYTYFIVYKNKQINAQRIAELISKQITNYIESSYGIFVSYDEVIIYYDNGQAELSRILLAATSVFPYKISIKDNRGVDCRQYKLSQVADLICTIELVEQKRQESKLSKSELEFFKSMSDFKKTYLIPIRSKCKK